MHQLVDVVDTRNSSILEKLEVDLTDGSPQLQDLGPYHLPLLPQYRLQPLCTQSSNKA